MMPDGSALKELKLMQEEDRRLARSSFLSFYQRMTGFYPQPHHKLLCKLVQRIEDDVIDRGMVFMPRRMAKSTICTQLAPAWIIGRHPKEKIMSAVHTQKYAAKTGKIVRNLIRSPLYPFDDVSLAADSQAKDQWATNEGGEYNGFGLMGGSTHGNPASWLFTDDLIKGRKMALSEHMRDEAWETYKADLVSSLQGREKQLMITTRWHMDDPAGRILPEDYNGETGWFRDRETGEKWFVLCLAAAAEFENDPLKRKKGEYMWPEAFTKKFNAAQKRGGWIWSALYQQRPNPEEGLMFNADHIGRYSPGKLDLNALQIYISSDYATTDEAGARDPDYTVHMVWGVDEAFNIFLLDMWRGRKEADVWTREFIRLVRKWKPLRAVEEAGQIIKSVGPFLKMMMRTEKVFVNRVQLTSSTSKEQRAHSLLGMASMGKMLLPNRAEISGGLLTNLDVFETELMQFPAGKHDDTVDAATLFGRFIDRILEGRRPPSKGSPHGETLDELWSRHDEEQSNPED